MDSATKDTKNTESFVTFVIFVANYHHTDCFKLPSAGLGGAKRLRYRCAWLRAIQPPTNVKPNGMF